MKEINIPEEIGNFFALLLIRNIIIMQLQLLKDIKVNEARICEMMLQVAKIFQYHCAK